MTKPTYEQLESRLKMVNGLARTSEYLLEEARKAFEASAGELAAVTAENVALTAENKKAVDAVTVFSNVTRDITEIICDELGNDRVAEILAAYNDLGNMPVTDRIVAWIKADGVEEFAAYCGDENSVFVEAKAYYRSLTDAAAEFSSMLRGEDSK